MHPRAKHILAGGINQVEKCILCQVVARSQKKKQPAIPIEVPLRPWQKIGIVLCICKMK